LRAPSPVAAAAPAAAGPEGGPREAPRVESPPARETPTQAASGGDNKYVVWSSAPTEVHRPAPEE
jgi:hypothetical protein